MLNKQNSQKAFFQPDVITALLSSSSIGGWGFLLGEKEYFFCDNCAAVLGLGNISLDMKTLLSYMVDESETLFQYHVEQLKNNHESFSIELSINDSARIKHQYKATGSLLQSGEDQWLLGTFQPIPDQQHLHLEDLYKTILEDQVEMVCRFLPDGTLIYANQSYCDFFGKQKEDIIGKKYQPVVFPEDVPKIQAQAAAMDESHPVRITENRVFRYDGEVRWTRWTSRAFFDENHNKIEEQAVGRDITEQKEKENDAIDQSRKLMEADKAISLGSLVGGIAHEINNPNNYILLNAPFLKEVTLAAIPFLESHYQKHGDFNLGALKYSQIKNEIEGLFDGIIEGGERINRIIEELRLFSSPDQSKYNQSVNINEVLKAVATILTNKIKKSTQHFSIQYGETIPAFKGSFQKMEQALLNIIQNACEALENSKGSIIITSEFDKESNSIIVNVADTGIGIPQGVLSQITNPFFTTKHRTDNTGLGLSISKQIIEKHNGSLEIESVVGKGTQVTILIPASS